MVVLVALALFVVGFFMLQKANQTKGLTKVEGFRYSEPGKPICDGLVPYCGYCPGKIIDKECYIKKL